MGLCIWMGLSDILDGTMCIDGTMCMDRGM